MDKLSPATRGPGRLSRPIMIAAILAAVAGVAVLWALLPLGSWIENFRTWVQTQGLMGHVIFAAVYALAAVALAPGSALTLAAGFAFGLAGFPTVVVGATIGAGVAFLIGRYVARGWVEKQVSGNATFKAIDKAIEGEGWKIVGLMRLSPLVPFNLQNSFFGVTKVGFWPYLATTFIGIMPGTLLFVWIGSLGAAAGMGYSGMSNAGAAGADSTVGLIKLAALALGLVATIAVTVLVSRKASQKLREAGVEAGAGS